VGLEGGRLIVIAYEDLRAADEAMRNRHDVQFLDSFTEAENQ